MGAEAGGECVDGFGMAQTPVHARQFAPPGHIRSAGGLDDTRAEVESRLAVHWIVYVRQSFFAAWFWWCAWRGSNPQPSAPEADALSN